MDEFLNLITKLLNIELLCRLLLAVAAGALVGIEREFHGRPAGLRTHILVSLGSAVVALISMELPRMSDVLGPETTTRIDPGRIASGVVTGMGFLGAGAIIRIGVTARGLTTAASLWCMAIVGMAFGFGLYELAVAASLLMLFALFVLGSVEKKISRRWYKSVSTSIRGGDDGIAQLIARFKDHGWRVIDIKLRKDKAKSSLVAEYELRLNEKQDVENLVTLLDDADCVESFSVS